MRLIFSILALVLITLGGNTSTAATMTIGDAYFGNPVVVAGSPGNVFVTSGGGDLGFTVYDPVTFAPTVVLAEGSASGATASFLADLGPVLWEIRGPAGFLIGDHPAGGGISSGITSVAASLTNSSAMILEIFSGSIKSGTLQFGFGDTYAALTAPSGGGGSPAPIPLPAATWLLISGLSCLGFLGRRRRSVAA